jgi:hypothetical protein
MHYGGAGRGQCQKKRSFIKIHSVSLACLLRTPPLSQWPRLNAFARVLDAALQPLQVEVRPVLCTCPLRHAGVRDPMYNTGRWADVRKPPPRINQHPDTRIRAWSICTSTAVHTGLFQSWNGAILNRGDQHVPRLERKWAPKFWPQVPWAPLPVVCISIILAMAEKKRDDILYRK